MVFQRFWGLTAFRGLAVLGGGKANHRDHGGEERAQRSLGRPEVDGVDGVERPSANCPLMTVKLS